MRVSGQIRAKVDCLHNATKRSTSLDGVRLSYGGDGLGALMGTLYL